MIPSPVTAEGIRANPKVTWQYVAEWMTLTEPQLCRLEFGHHLLYMAEGMTRKGQ